MKESGQWDWIYSKEMATNWKWKKSEDKCGFGQERDKASLNSRSGIFKEVKDDKW